MVSFWIDYGTNYIGGVGETQSEAAWRLPIALQLVPALILGFPTVLNDVLDLYVQLDDVNVIER